MIWFTSDLHFGHASILKYCPRPFDDVESMNERLIQNWNKRVRAEDTIYVVGDMALCPFKDFKPIGERLQGKKILIKGNHDHYSTSQYESVGFTVYTELKMLLAGKCVRMSHYPYAPLWYKRPFCYPSELRFLERRPPRVKGEFLIHGHVHMPYRRRGNRLHVGVDAWDYSPVSAVQLESLMNLKEYSNDR